MELGLVLYTKGHVDRAAFAGEVARLLERAPVDLHLVQHGYGRLVPVKVGGAWTKRVQLQGARGHGACPYTFYDAGMDAK